MGSVKEMMLQVREDREQLIADELEIPTEVLHACTYTLTPIVSDDGMVYYYALNFTNIPDEFIEEWEGTLFHHPIQIDISLFEDNDVDYFDELKSISANKDPYAQYQNEITKLAKLMTLEVPQQRLEETLHKQIFIGVVGVMEAYLSDTFMNSVLKSDFFFRKFVETNPELSKQRFNLNEIFDKYDQLKTTVKEALLKVSYHNLPTVRPIYKATFNIDFPIIKEARRFVLMRHDLVHRNGKTIDGNSILVTKDLLSSLIACTNSLVDKVEKEMRQAFLDHLEYEVPF